MASLSLRRAGLAAAAVLWAAGIGVNGMDKGILNIPKGWSGIVAYGTLMSRPVMEQSLGRKYPDQVYFVHLRDYVRGWEFRRPLNDPQAGPPGKRISAAYVTEEGEVSVDGLISLNVYPQKGTRLNGVLYLLSGEDMLKVDKVENGYRRTDVTDKIEEYDISGGKVYVYEGLPVGQAAAAADPTKYILVKEYLDQVARAAEDIGGGFSAEYDRSTRPVSYRVVPVNKIVWKQEDKK